ncbi:STM3941 family protein [Paenibacillus sp. GCM10028914]|uniref:STM3941 family protein n=1 Tax=Paenibacillus sp. GCM10028914 TaxID=3273416 RepID=UPI00362015F0
MNNNEDIVVYPKLGKLVFFSVIFVLLGIAITYFGLTEDDGSMAIVAIGVLCTIFFGFGLIYFISRLVNKRPSLIVNDEGITDQSSYIQAGVIKWEDIKEIKLYSMMNQRMIGIILYHPENFMSKQSGFKKLLMRANQGLVDTPINIAESSLPISLDELYMIILNKWELSTREASASLED